LAHGCSKFVAKIRNSPYLTRTKISRFNPKGFRSNKCEIFTIIVPGEYLQRLINVANPSLDSSKTNSCTFKIDFVMTILITVNSEKTKKGIILGLAVGTSHPLVAAFAKINKH